jgi:hypothetical protein
MKRLNQSPVLQAQRVSMEASSVEEEILPTGRKFFLSCRQLPWSNDRPLAPPPLSRSQPRQAALWKRKSASRGTLGTKFDCHYGRGPCHGSAAANDFSVATMDEDPGTNEADDEADEQAHPTPSSCRLTEDHLVLIFEMRKDLAEKQHRQCTLNKCLDVHL